MNYFSLLIAAGGLAALLMLVACSDGEGDNTGAGSGTPDPSQPADLGKITLPPEQTFADNCSRCHGPEGAFYARPFMYQGEKLRQVIEEMMVDKAGLNPTDADIDAMLQYHLQLRE